VRKRTKARQLALQLLYRLDLLGDEANPDRLHFLREQTSDAEVLDFASDLVEGTIRHRDDLDARIREVARNWDIGRMAVLDRNILRMGAYELVYRDDIPPKVSLNEAIELAKRFSTADSGAFVNGILDKVKDRIYGSGPG
jgi:transcription antitermination factor NusB